MKATIQEIPVLLSYPIERQVELVYPPGSFSTKYNTKDQQYTLKLKEDVVDDGTSGNTGAVDTWNGFSASGEATGEIGKILVKKTGSQ